jgi:hypothetical protein
LQGSEPVRKDVDFMGTKGEKILDQSPISRGLEFAYDARGSMGGILRQGCPYEKGEEDRSERQKNQA